MVTQESNPNLRVLVVDDTRTARMHLRIILQQGGYDVREATCGTDALRQVNEWIPDVVLMDWQMPDMDGLECMRRIKAIPACHQVRTMIVSGEDDRHKMTAAFQNGCNDYITKPFSEEELLDRLAKVVRFISLARRAMVMGLVVERPEIQADL